MSEPIGSWNPDNLWESHPLYSIDWWRYEVANGDTLLGYREWVKDKYRQDTE
jgi:hypothetical protein